MTKDNEDLLQTPEGKAAKYLDDVLKRMELEYVTSTGINNPHSIDAKIQSELDDVFQDFRHRMHQTTLMILPA